MVTSKFQVLLFIMFECPMSHIQSFFLYIYIYIFFFFFEYQLNVWVICRPFGIEMLGPVWNRKLLNCCENNFGLEIHVAIFRRCKVMFKFCCLSYVTKLTHNLLKHVFLLRGNLLLIFHMNPSKG